MTPNSSWLPEQKDRIRYLVHDALKVLGKKVTVEKHDFFSRTETDSGRATVFVGNCVSVLFQVSWKRWAMDLRLEPRVV